jgi:hypothetical protein
MRRALLTIAVSLLGASAPAQLATHNGDSLAQNANPVHRTRLILKDGTYQIVLSYKVVGQRVQYLSAERGAEMEEIPVDLVDLPATKQWEQQHTAASEAIADNPQLRPAPVLSPELAREEAERLELSPEVAPNLRLVPEDSVLALDTWHGAPELVPLLQSQGDLNKETGHSILRQVLKPNAARHQVLVLPGEKSPVQMHVAQPVFYIRMDDDAVPSSDVMTVDTHGATSSQGVKENEKSTGPRDYAIVRVDVRQDARVVASFNTSALGSTKRQEDVIDTTSTPLPGGHWIRVVPTGPLLFGEYCLVEILGDNQINLGVWDFGVHPSEPENRDVLQPQLPHTTLEHHPDN